MTDDLAWVPIGTRQPHDRELVYARVQSGKPHKVRFYTQPSPRWVGANIVFQFEYFREWAPLERLEQTLDRTG